MIIPQASRRFTTEARSYPKILGDSPLGQSHITGFLEIHHWNRIIPNDSRRFTKGVIYQRGRVIHKASRRFTTEAGSSTRILGDSPPGQSHITGFLKIHHWNRIIPKDSRRFTTGLGSYTRRLLRESSLRQDHTWCFLEIHHWGRIIPKDSPLGQKHVQDYWQVILFTTVRGHLCHTCNTSVVF